MWERREEILPRFNEIRDEIKKLEYQKEGGIPYNPLLKNWQELSIKRALS